MEDLFEETKSLFEETKSLFGETKSLFGETKSLFEETSIEELLNIANYYGLKMGPDIKTKSHLISFLLANLSEKEIREALAIILPLKLSQSVETKHQLEFFQSLQSLRPQDGLVPTFFSEILSLSPSARQDFEKAMAKDYSILVRRDPSKFSTAYTIPVYYNPKEKRNESIIIIADRNKANLDRILTVLPGNNFPDSKVFQSFYLGFIDVELQNLYIQVMTDMTHIFFELQNAIRDDEFRDLRKETIKKKKILRETYDPKSFSYSEEYRRLQKEYARKRFLIEYKGVYRTGRIGRELYLANVPIPYGLFYQQDLIKILACYQEFTSILLCLEKYSLEAVERLGPPTLGENISKSHLEIYKRQFDTLEKDKARASKRF